MLETSILNQVRSVFQNLEAQYTFHITCHPRHESAQELTELLKDVAGCSDKLSCEVTETEEPKLEFSLLKNGKETGVKFRGIPNGHEFTSLLLAILNADGKGKNLPDEAIRRRIQALKGPISLQTYVSLTCTNCPDVVQALNIMALLNGQVTHEMIDGALFQEEVDALKIQGVPSVYANGKLLHGVNGGAGEIGHITVQPNGYLCTCGKNGCLETYASATGIVRVADDMAKEFNGTSRLKELIDDGDEKITSKLVFYLADNGDILANQVVDRICFYLGLALSMIGNTLNPASIIIGGGVSNAGNTLLQPTTKYFQQNAFPSVRDSTKIKLAKLGNDAGVIGAASMALQFR